MQIAAFVRKRPFTTIVAAAVAVALVLGVHHVASGKAYTVELLMPSADTAFKNGTVEMQGRAVGTVKDVGVQDGQALVTVAIDKQYAPLPAGTTARIMWASVLGARRIELVPGKASNPGLPSGQLITGNTEAVDIDDLLATLDAPTRANLQKMIGGLNNTLNAGNPDLHTTLLQTGATVKAIGDLLSAIGQDGPAIKEIVTQLHGMTQTVAAHDGQLAESINNLNTLTAAVAARQGELSQTIAQLPQTITAATTALNDVPHPIAATRKLLQTLRPATDQLPAIAAVAKPALADADAALAYVPSTLTDLQSLLKYTPALLRNTNGTLPTATSALAQLDPMVSFLRPYTPELVGWLSNWDGVFGSRDSSGHYARALITASASSFDNNPGIMPPGMTQDPTPAPGSIAGQPWTDANGDGIH